MSKIILTLVVSTLLTLAVIAMFQKGPRSRGITQPGGLELPVALTNANSSTTNAVPNNEKIVEQTVQQNEATVRPGTHEPLVMPEQPHIESPHTDLPELKQSQPSSEPGSSSGPDLSLYTPEIAELLDDSMPMRLQKRYELDEREDSWASSMEEKLLTYLDQRLAPSQFYIARVDCRTFNCEIHLLGHSSNAILFWESTTWDLINQPWHDFDRMFTSTSNVRLDVIGIAYMLSIDNF